MSSVSTVPTVPARFILLEDDEKLPLEFVPLQAAVKHMSQGTPVSQYQGLKHAAMFRFNKEESSCQLTVKPCPAEPLSTEPFVCGAASVEDSLTVYYVDGLTAASFTATIHRTVAGHPIIDVTDRGMYRVELKQ